MKFSHHASAEFVGYAPILTKEEISISIDGEGSFDQNDIFFLNVYGTNSMCFMSFFGCDASDFYVQQQIQTKLQVKVF